MNFTKTTKPWKVKDKDNYQEKVSILPNEAQKVSGFFSGSIAVLEGNGMKYSNFG